MANAVPAVMIRYKLRPRPGQLSRLETFQRFRTTLDERCAEPLVMTELHAVDSFGFD